MHVREEMGGVLLRSNLLAALSIFLQAKSPQFIVVIMHCEEELYILTNIAVSSVCSGIRLFVDEVFASCVISGN